MTSNTRMHETEFIRLLTNHQVVLRALIVSMLPGSPDINDLLQDTNVVLWEKKNSFKANTDFKAWAYAVARNKVMQYWTQQKKLSRISLNEDIVATVADMQSQNRPEGLSQQHIALNLCLNNLNKEELNIVEARYGKHGGLEALASECGRSAPSLRVTLFRIRQKLRECIESRLLEERGSA